MYIKLQDRPTGSQQIMFSLSLQIERELCYYSCRKERKALHLLVFFFYGNATILSCSIRDLRSVIFQGYYSPAYHLKMRFSLEKIYIWIFIWVFLIVYMLLLYMLTKILALFGSCTRSSFETTWICRDVGFAEMLVSSRLEDCYTE